MAAPRAKPEILAPDDVFPPTQTQVIQQPEQPDESDSALLNIIADLGGAIDAKVNVYKAEKGSRQMAYVGSYDAADFSLDSIKAEYGGGSYRIHVRRDGALVANRLLTIAESRNKPEVIAAAGPQLNPADLIATMQQGFATLGQSLLQGMAQMIPPPVPAKSTQEMLQEMLTMKQLLAPAHESAPVDQFAIFRQGMELAAQMQPREGDVGTNELMLEAIKSLGPVLGSAIQKPAFNPQIAGPGVVPPAPQLPAPPFVSHSMPQPAQHAEPQPQPPEGADMSLQEKLFFNTVIAAANADADPATYSALVLDLLGNDQALRLVSLPDWFEQLVAREPRAFAHKPWFEEMRENIYLLTETPLPGIPENNSEPGTIHADSGQPTATPVTP